MSNLQHREPLARGPLKHWAPSDRAGRNSSMIGPLAMSNLQHREPLARGRSSVGRRVIEQAAILP